MVVHTSALTAIMDNEPERCRFKELIEAATATYVSTASLLETRMILFARSGDSAVLALDAFPSQERHDSSWRIRLVSPTSLSMPTGEYGKRQRSSSGLEL